MRCGGLPRFSFPREDGGARRGLGRAGLFGAFLLLLLGTAGAFVIAPAHGVRAPTMLGRGRLPQSGPTSKRARRGVCAAAMGLEVWGSQGSRSPLVNWYLHELGVPFEMAALEKNPHPFGQIPSLKDGSVEVFESGAILLYLAQKYGGAHSAEAMAEVAKWVVWANSSLDPILFVENQRGQVIGTRLIENPKGIQVRACGATFARPAVSAVWRAYCGSATTHLWRRVHPTPR